MMFLWLVIGFIIGVVTIGIFSSNQYDKGYKDGAADWLSDTMRKMNK